VPKKKRNKNVRLIILNHKKRSPKLVLLF